jgi:hypothetical protein
MVVPRMATITVKLSLVSGKLRQDQCLGRLGPIDLDDEQHRDIRE